MVRGSLRSRTYRRIHVRVPKGRVIQYKKRKPKQHRCAGCGDALKGMPRASPAELRSMAKTQKRPERPFGGVLCSRCTRQRITVKARSMEFKGASQ
ncbi:MAG TPA: 50S ribosomal protein L34e [Candidatus Nanoarchaeia archaeon]|nr:50S ribosomal protein L34e [Candidatus Nanoarchaeia archaeon]